MAKTYQLLPQGSNEIDAHKSVLRRACLTSVAVLVLAFLVSCSLTGFNPLQLAYNLNHSETFVEYGKKYRKALGDVRAPLPTPISLANSGFVSWNASSVLKDNAERKDYIFSEKVTILGFRWTVSMTGKQKVPDLVPFSPSGRYRSAFCRLEQGRKLRVTVKNQG
ncbi:MAG: hypothetical protein ACREX9_05945, partial [Gammaproteobacteria bacterium]